MKRQDNTAQLREVREQLEASHEQKMRLETELSQVRISEASVKRQLAEMEKEAIEKIRHLEEVSRSTYFFKHLQVYVNLKGH